VSCANEAQHREFAIVCIESICQASTRIIPARFTVLPNSRGPIQTSTLSLSLMRTRFPQGRHRFTAVVWHTHRRQLRREASSAAKGNRESLRPLLQDVRLRRGSNRPLPLPPALKPVATPATTRWKEHKPDPDLDNLTPFQKKLYQNPYGPRNQPYYHLTSR